MKLDLMFIKLFVVKFRGSWKLDMAYSNTLAQLSLHLKAKKKKSRIFTSRNLTKFNFDNIVSFNDKLVYTCTKMTGFYWLSLVRLKVIVA